MSEIRDDRIIGLIRQNVMTAGEVAFCMAMYGREALSEAQNVEIRRISRKYSLII